MIAYNFAEDFFCQQPRFVMPGAAIVKRPPASIYMRYEVAKNLTYYIISADEFEECVVSFKNLLSTACQSGAENGSGQATLQHPLEAHILLSKILCESSQGYISHFRQSMFQQVPVFSLWIICITLTFTCHLASSC